MPILNAILPIFLVIFLGFMLRRLGFFDEAFVKVLNQMVYHIVLPVLVFWEISRSPFQESFNGWLVAVVFMAMGFMFLLIMASGKLMGFTPAQIGSLAQGSFRGNIAYIGLALVANIYGNQGLSKAGVLAGFMIPFMNFFSILGLVSQSSQIQGLLSWKTLFRSVLLNALIIGSFLGLLFSFFAWTLPPILANTFKMISGLSLPLALLSMGGNLSLQGIQGGLVPTIWASFLKLLGLPLFGLALMQIWHIGGLDFKITILLLSCPTAVVTYIMSSELGGDQDLSASIVMLTTLVSMVTITVWVWFVGL
jgi:malate permease and related proteins